MRANLLRLRRAPSGGPPRRRRFLRASVLRLVLLGGVAAALVVFDALEIEIFREWREALLDPAEFTLCGKANRQNCVIDGDTIRHNGVVVRILGIDAPETRDFECESERALGRRATRRLLELINAGPVAVVYRGGRDADKYGRKLRVLERDGRSLGDMLVAEGLARRWDGANRSWCR